MIRIRLIPKDPPQEPIIHLLAPFYSIQTVTSIVDRAIQEGVPLRLFSSAERKIELDVTRYETIAVNDIAPDDGEGPEA